MNAILRPRAKQDLDDHAAYLTRHAGIDVALRFLENAEQTLENLAQMPGIGSPYSLSNPSFRLLRSFSIRRFPKHLIFYCELSDGRIEVIRILHGSRNISAILEAESN